MGEILVLHKYMAENGSRKFLATLDSRDFNGSWRQPTMFGPNLSTNSLRRLVLVADSVLVTQEKLETVLTFSNATVFSSFMLKDLNSKNAKKVSQSVIKYNGAFSVGFSHLATLIYQSELLQMDQITNNTLL